MTSGKPGNPKLTSLRPNYNANNKSKEKDKESLKNICGNEEEDLETVNKWKRQVEKESKEQAEKEQFGKKS